MQRSSLSNYVKTNNLDKSATKFPLMIHDLATRKSLPKIGGNDLRSQPSVIKSRDQKGLVIRGRSELGKFQKSLKTNAAPSFRRDTSGWQQTAYGHFGAPSIENQDVNNRSLDDGHLRQDRSQNPPRTSYLRNKPVKKGGLAENIQKSQIKAETRMNFNPYQIAGARFSSEMSQRERDMIKVQQQTMTSANFDQDSLFLSQNLRTKLGRTGMSERRIDIGKIGTSLKVQTKSRKVMAQFVSGSQTTNETRGLRWKGAAIHQNTQNTKQGTTVETDTTAGHAAAHVTTTPMSRQSSLAVIENVKKCYTPLDLGTFPNKTTVQVRHHSRDDIKDPPMVMDDGNSEQLGINTSAEQPSVSTGFPQERPVNMGIDQQIQHAFQTNFSKNSFRFSGAPTQKTLSRQNKIINKSSKGLGSRVPSEPYIPMMPDKRQTNLATTIQTINSNKASQILKLDKMTSNLQSIMGSTSNAILQNQQLLDKKIPLTSNTSIQMETRPAKCGTFKYKTRREMHQIMQRASLKGLSQKKIGHPLAGKEMNQYASAHHINLSAAGLHRVQDNSMLRYLNAPSERQMHGTSIGFRSTDSIQSRNDQHHLIQRSQSELQRMTNTIGTQMHNSFRKPREHASVYSIVESPERQILKQYGIRNSTLQQAEKINLQKQMVVPARANKKASARLIDTAHSFAKGKKMHLKEYKEALQLRKEFLQGAIDDQVVSFQNSHIGEVEGDQSEECGGGSQVNVQNAEDPETLYGVQRANSGAIQEDGNKAVDRLQNISVHDQMAQIKTLDEIDFDYKQKIHGGCDKCTRMSGDDRQKYVKKDPKMFDFVVRYRAIFKKQRNQSQQQQQFFNSNRLGSDKSEKFPWEESIERREALRRANFPEWEEKMWIHYAKTMYEKELASRPKYIKLYDKASKLHMDGYWEELNLKTLIEQEAKESLDRQEKSVKDFRRNLEFVLRQSDIDAEELLRHLILPEDGVQRQTRFFSEVKGLEFQDQKLKLFEMLNDRDEYLPTNPDPQNNLKESIDSEREQNSIKENEFLNHLLAIKNREEFLQRQIKEIYEAKNKTSEETDQSVEFAKRCEHNFGAARASLIVNHQQSKIDPEKFVVLDHHLTEGQIKSIGDCFPRIKNFIRKIYLSNSSITSQLLAHLLNQLSPKQVHELQGIVLIGRNNFGKESLQVLKDKLLNKRGSSTFVELKLLGCQVEPTVVYDLLNEIRSDFKLQTLALSNIGLSQRAVELMTKIIASRPASLRSLDISANRILSSQTANIFLSLRGHLNLRHLNISFNPISKDQDVKALCQFIGLNKSLQLLNLSGVLQTPLQVQKVIKRVSKSRSLLSVHLSYTGCIQNDRNLQKYIHLKLRIKNSSTKESIISGTYGNELPSLDNIGEVTEWWIGQAENEQKGWLRQYELVLASRAHHRELSYFDRQIYDPKDQPKWQSTFILQRTHAHPEIRGNSCWHISNESCYVCDRWQYTIFYARSRLGQNGEKLLPVISGSFTLLNNKQIELMDVREFARCIVENTQDPETDKARYLQLLCGSKELILTEPDLMEEDEKELVQKFEKRFKEKDLSLYQDDCGDGRPVFMRAIFEMLSTKKDIQFVGAPGEENPFREVHLTVPEGQDPELYVFADFMKAEVLPQIIFRDQCTDQEQLRAFVPGVRAIELPEYQPQADLLNQKKPFDKEKSVFKAWVEDSPAVLRQALQRDLGLWKVSKMLGRDQNDLKECQEIINRHYAILKHMYVNLQCGDNYPFIGWSDFRQFCTDVKILDGTLDGSNVDLQFVATKGSTKPENGLNRHEFLEALTRVAGAKFKSSGRAPSFSESLNLLFSTILKKYKFKPWQEFRDDRLWTTDVDALLKANIELLQKVHDRLFLIKGQGDGLTACINLLTKQTNIGLSERTVKFCFGMSKMTVRDEVNNGSEYGKMRFPEFLEFLGRLAHSRFDGDLPMPLEQTLPPILDAVLGAYGLQRQDVQNDDFDAVSSEESLQDLEVEPQPRDSLSNDLKNLF